MTGKGRKSKYTGCDSKTTTKTNKDSMGINPGL